MLIPTFETYSCTTNGLVIARSRLGSPGRLFFMVATYCQKEQLLLLMILKGAKS